MAARADDDVLMTYDNVDEATALADRHGLTHWPVAMLTTRR